MIDLKILGPLLFFVKGSLNVVISCEIESLPTVEFGTWNEKHQHCSSPLVPHFVLFGNSVLNFKCLINLIFLIEFVLKRYFIE